MIESSISRYFVNKIMSASREIQIVSIEWNPLVSWNITVQGLDQIFVLNNTIIYSQQAFDKTKH